MHTGRTLHMMGEQMTDTMSQVGQSLFRRAVEASGHSIYFTDENGVVEYVNPAFEETTGYSAEEAVGRTPRILKSSEHDRAFYETLWDTITAGEIWRNELINERKSGELYVVYQTIAPVTDGSGAITNFVAINVDVTERYTYKRHLELQNERLDDFSSVLSHDLKNLLTNAAGNVELARETGDVEHLEKVERAHDRMRELTSELLALAQAGKLVEETERVTVSNLAEDAWATAATPDATLEFENADVELRADRSRFKQVFENLFHNAIDHAGGDVTIRVGVEDRCLYVADDGAGIPPSEEREVFEKGYTTNDAGTGYGLAIVESVVEAHGWTVDVTESRSGGARFEITDVPLKE